MRKMLSKTALVISVLVCGLPAESQLRPSSPDQYPPNPPVNRIEVRFAIGKEAVTCKSFALKVKSSSHTLISGAFVSGFSIPSAALTNNEMLDLQITCGKHIWQFSNVGPRALRRGWWWVGTDYPPFQETFQDNDLFKEAVWIKYLIVDPIGDEGFNVYKFCPAKLKDQRPGPCFSE